MKSKRRDKGANRYLIIAAVLALVSAGSGILLFRELKQTKQEAETFAELSALRLPRSEASAKPTDRPAPIQIVIPTDMTKEDRSAANADSAGTPAEGIPETIEAAPEEKTTPTEEVQAAETHSDPVPLERYQPLFELNHDFFGWITIPDTRVDYPVMYNAKNPLAYLGHDFYGNFSYAGVPFLDSNCDPNGDFYLVYGHKMNDGSMFADLVVYKDRSFWETHRTFSFDTLYEERTYEVVMAIKARVLDRDEKNGFRYYNYASLDTEAEFDDYIDQARKLSCYDTGIEPVYGDELLVLSTCYHYTQNGRFVLIARRVG